MLYCGRVTFPSTFPMPSQSNYPTNRLPDGYVYTPCPHQPPSRRTYVYTPCPHTHSGVYVDVVHLPEVLPGFWVGELREQLDILPPEGGSTQLLSAVGRRARVDVFVDIEHWWETTERNGILHCRECNLQLFSAIVLYQSKIGLFHPQSNEFQLTRIWVSVLGDLQDAQREGVILGLPLFVQVLEGLPMQELSVDILRVHHQGHRGVGVLVVVACMQMYVCACDLRRWTCESYIKS